MEIVEEFVFVFFFGPWVAAVGNVFCRRGSPVCATSRRSFSCCSSFFVLTSASAFFVHVCVLCVCVILCPEGLFDGPPKYSRSVSGSPQHFCSPRHLAPRPGQCRG